MKFCLIYDEIFKEHKPPTYHPENPGRIEHIWRHLNDKRIIGKILTIKPQRSSENLAILVHDKKYVDIILGMCEEARKISEPIMIDGDTYVSSGTCNAALTAIDAVITGIELVLRSEYSGFYATVRPPGHHAGIYGRALTAPTQGFCIFNNVAIGAKYLIDRKKFNKVLILDIDVHHGNGTQEIFYPNPQVMYVSTHQDPLTIYPGTGRISEIGEGEGEGYNVNIPLPPGTSDDTYKDVINEIIIPLIEQYKPEFILISLGFDAHKDDPLANLNLSLNSYELVYSVLKRYVGKYVKGLGFVLEGGYNFNVLSKGSEILLCLMNDIEYTVNEDKTEATPRIKSRVKEVIKELKNILKKYWNMS